MQERQDWSDYPIANDPSVSSTLSSGGKARTAVSILEPYYPPNVPHGLPHVVRYATLSSMDLPLEVRFLIIMIARFANVHGVASVANSTLGEICRIGSHHTVERWISLASDVGILRKEPGKGGKDRKSNSYTFLGEDRAWAPLPVGRPDTNPLVALAHARLLIEELQAKAARVDELEAELALLRNDHSNGHSEVTNGEGGPLAGPPSGSYETADSGSSQETRGAIGHSEVTNGSHEDPSEEASHSYETPDSGTSQENHQAISHSKVTDGSPENPSEESSRSYETPDSASSQGNHGAIGHSGVTNGSSEDPPDEASHSYKTPDSGTSQETHGAIRHSEVPNGSDEGQEYLARRARVQDLVMHHRAYYTRSFNRGGLPSAVEYFSRSPEHEQELMHQVSLLDAGGDPRQSGTGPPPEPEAQSQASADSDRYGVGQCPDCGRPFATHGGATHCTDCTARRRRESEA